ncbi:MAG: 2-amino-4-hydroxy-6-hydroxymethyldihydropteridine diphosphokinase [Muribaculaceae bacterium]|nr:2-amino-4-hydroxy-6-hydroxymethyldihydropteridine diphosphokinase [Muribaculaceae bacterium]
MSRYFISIGSNCGDRRGEVTMALHWLYGLGGALSASSIYETPEIHGLDRPYINAVAALDIDLEPMVLNKRLKEYERSRGRDEECRHRGDVPIDIDLVAIADTILRPKDFSHEFFQIGYRQLI